MPTGINGLNYIYTQSILQYSSRTFFFKFCIFFLHFYETSTSAFFSSKFCECKCHFLCGWPADTNVWYNTMHRQSQKWCITNRNQILFTIFLIDLVPNRSDYGKYIPNLGLIQQMILYMVAFCFCLIAPNSSYTRNWTWWSDWGVRWLVWVLTRFRHMWFWS